MSDAFRSAIAASEGKITVVQDKPVSDSEMDSDSELAPTMTSLGALPKARNSLFPSSQPAGERVWAPARESRSTVPKPRVNNFSKDASPSPPISPSLQRFRDLVNNVEKSTVVFNLNLGRTPLTNKSTMGIKATAALTAMAAAAENRPANNPSPDTVATIDDALSVADGISFFGKATKSVKNGKSDSGSFCTIPVCYFFPDKDTRANVEQVIRTTCKASCATPYPQALRACIKLALEDGKKVRLDDYCSVSLDLPKLALRVLWREKNSSTWIRYNKLIPIPEDVIESPTIPPAGGIRLLNLPSYSLGEDITAGDNNTISMATIAAQYIGLNPVTAPPSAP